MTGEIAIVPSDGDAPGTEPRRGGAGVSRPAVRLGPRRAGARRLRRGGWLADGALAVVELAAKEAFSPPIGFETVDARRYGAARLIFLRHAP